MAGCGQWTGQHGGAPPQVVSHEVVKSTVLAECWVAHVVRTHQRPVRRLYASLCKPQGQVLLWTKRGRQCATRKTFCVRKAKKTVHDVRVSSGAFRIALYSTAPLSTSVFLLQGSLQAHRTAAPGGAGSGPRSTARRPPGSATAPGARRAAAWRGACWGPGHRPRRAGTTASAS